jgi:cyanophycinase
VEIIGKGTVIFINTKTMTHTNQSKVESTEPLSLHNLQVSILCHGDRYHLHKHQATGPKSGA